MIMKQAIEYDSAGSAKNEPNGTVHFRLKGGSDRLDATLVAIRAGTKKSSAQIKPQWTPRFEHVYDH
jgi:acylphosphatase